MNHNKILEFSLCNADLDYTNREISDRKGKSSLKVHLMRKEDLISDKARFVPIPTQYHLKISVYYYFFLAEEAAFRKSAYVLFSV